MNNISALVQLGQKEKQDVLDTLEQVIKDGVPDIELRHKIQKIRNVIFSSLHAAASETLLNQVPVDIWSQILSRTTPKTVAVCRSVSTKIKKAATGKEQILAINQGLNLAEVLPSEIENLEEALNWLANTGYCHLLEHADLVNFSIDYLDDLERLFKISPNLKFLAIHSSISSLPELPKTLEVLDCFQADFDKLPELPPTLRVLICVDCPLTVLPKLPPTLRELNCSECGLELLPELPSSLRVLDCSRTPLTRILALPEALEELDFRDCDELEKPPTLPASLKKLNGLPIEPTAPLMEAPEDAPEAQASSGKREREESDSNGEDRTVRSKIESPSVPA